MSDDFEVCPVGTQARVAELESRIAYLERLIERERESTIRRLESAEAIRRSVEAHRAALQDQIVKFVSRQPRPPRSCSPYRCGKPVSLDREGVSRTCDLERGHRGDCMA